VFDMNPRQHSPAIVDVRRQTNSNNVANLVIVMLVVLIREIRKSQICETIVKAYTLKCVTASYITSNIISWSKVNVCSCVITRGTVFSVGLTVCTVHHKPFYIDFKSPRCIRHFYIVIDLLVFFTRIQTGYLVKAYLQQ